MSARAHDEHGFTLAELLVAIAITGVVFTTLTAAVMLGLRSTRDGDTGLTESNAAQLASHYYTRDVHGAEQVVIDDPSGSCGGPAELKLVSPVADRIVAYAAVGTPPRLVRRLCEPASAAPFETTLAVAVVDVSASCPVPCTRVTMRIDQPGSEDHVGLTVSLVGNPRASTAG
jgi:prepilin-type N-terminal cleavage/methylation domain-containing protein